MTGGLSGPGAGILVDDRLQTSAEGVYAAGDVAQAADLQSGERRVHAVQPTAVDHGRVAAANMAGEDVRYAGSLIMNILDAEGLEACSFGDWRGRDRDVTVVENTRIGSTASTFGTKMYSSAEFWSVRRWPSPTRTMSAC